MTIDVTLSNISNLQDTTSSQTVLNNNSAAIEVGFTTALNTAGDTMAGNLDMNSNQILNLPSPATANSPLRLADIGTVTVNPSIVSGNNVYTGNNNFTGTSTFAHITATTSNVSTATINTLSATNAIISNSALVNTIRSISPTGQGLILDFQNSTGAQGILAAGGTAQFVWSPTLFGPATATSLQSLGWSGGPWGTAQINSITTNSISTPFTGISGGTLTINSVTSTSPGTIVFNGTGQGSILSNNNNGLGIGSAGNIQIEADNNSDGSGAVLLQKGTSLGLSIGGVSTGDAGVIVGTGTSLGTGYLNAQNGIYTMSTIGFTPGVGSGASISQTTSRTTAVTINKGTGTISTFSGAGSTANTAFVVNNSLVGVNDSIILGVQQSPIGTYQTFATKITSGAFTVNYYVPSGGTLTTESFTINFAVLKGSIN